MCRYIQETILLKKNSKNVKGVVVPPRNVPKLGIRGVHDIQGRIGPAAPPPLRAVGPWLNHAFFINLYVVKHI